MPNPAIASAWMATLLIAVVAAAPSRADEPDDAGTAADAGVDGETDDQAARP